MKKNAPKFSLITPTYQRPEALDRAINSVLHQSHEQWEMIIINDSPGHEGYREIVQKYPDERIKFLTNTENLGANTSRNKGLEEVSNDSERIIFLDDDDWLATNALAELAKAITDHPQEKWLMTNRVSLDNDVRTTAPKNFTRYHYTRDYLIGKRIKGDATHCIEVKAARSIHFPTLVKNGEEWIYFFDLSLKVQPFYINLDTTLTGGYDSEGLNFRSRGIATQLRMLAALFKEGKERGFYLNPYFLVYLTMRGLRAFIK